MVLVKFFTGRFYILGIDLSKSMDSPVLSGMFIRGVVGGAICCTMRRWPTGSVKVSPSSARSRSRRAEHLAAGSSKLYL